MKINYAIRSKFTAPCTKSMAAQQKRLEAGQVTVTLQVDNAAGFETDWAGSEPTRFPARIKAAATALRDCGCMGAFVISHADGVVSVQKTAP